MPEKNLQEIVAVWPKAHAAAVDALAGVGAGEPVAKHQLHRQRAGEAAAKVVREAGIKAKRVRAAIVWTGDKPMVSIEVITMEGQRYEGGSEVDLRRVVDDAAPSPDAVDDVRVPVVDASTKRRFWESVKASDPTPK